MGFGLPTYGGQGREDGTLIWVVEGWRGESRLVVDGGSVLVCLWVGGGGVSCLESGMYTHKLTQGVLNRYKHSLPSPDRYKHIYATYAITRTSICGSIGLSSFVPQHIKSGAEVYFRTA